MSELMAHTISGYVEADGRERSDFPIICDACLGDNPYIRMLRDNLHEFVTEPEREDREGFLAKLQDTEDWLYEDAEHETKGVYIAKLEELNKQGHPIEQHYKEHTERASTQNIEKSLHKFNASKEKLRTVK